MDITSAISHLQQAILALTNQLSGADPELNRVDQFVEECCRYVPGHLVTFCEFYDRFSDWLPTPERYQWSKIRVTRSLPDRHPCGAHTNNVKCVANIDFLPHQSMGKPFILASVGARKILVQP
jgi:hypothetical protein